MAGQVRRRKAMAGKARVMCLRHRYAQIATNFPRKKFVNLRVTGHGGTPI